MEKQFPSIWFGVSVWNTPLRYRLRSAMCFHGSQEPLVPCLRDLPYISLTPLPEELQRELHRPWIGLHICDSPNEHPAWRTLSVDPSGFGGKHQLVLRGPQVLS